MAATTAANEAIYSRLAAMPRFNPASGSFFADWTLDPGDVVTVSQDGKSYSVPVFQMNIDWKGQSMVDLQATGSEKRPPPAMLNRNSYGGRSAQSKIEQDIVKHQLSIDKSDEKLTILATEDEWSFLKGEYERTSTTQIDITAQGLSSIVTGVEAGNFNPNQSYTVGAVVVRNGKIYKFTSAHVAGTPWDFDEVEEAWNMYGSMATHQTQIIQTSTRVGMVVNENGIRAGQIMLAINGGTGHSEALIEADKIQISGNTTLDGQLTVDDGALKVKTILLVNGTTNGTVSINNGWVTSKYHQVSANGAIRFIGSGTQTYYDLNATTVRDLHASASIANDTLTVSKLGGGSAFTIAKSGDTLVVSDGTTSITFSRAATSYISGSWSNGVYSAGPDSSSSSTTASTDLFEHLASPTLTLENGYIKVSGEAYTAGYVSGDRIADSSTGRTITNTFLAQNYLDTVLGAEAGASEIEILPQSGSIGLASVTIEPIEFGSKQNSKPSGTTLISTLTENGYYTVGVDGCVRVNVTASGARSVSTLLANGGDVNVGSKVYTVDVDITYTDGTSGASTIPIALTVTHQTGSPTYGIVVAGITGVSIDASGLFDEGFDAVDVGDVTVSGDSSLTKSEMPTAGLTYSGGYVSGYIWIERSNSTWERLDYFQSALPTTATWGYQQVTSRVWNISCTVGGKTYTSQHTF